MFLSCKDTVAKVPAVSAATLSIFASVRSRLCYRQNSDCFQKKKRQALQRYAVCHDSTKASQGTVG